MHSSNNHIDNLQGRILSERYRVEKILGQGGMGTVYLAKDKRAFGRNVVIKIPLDFPQDNQFIEQFKLECQQLIKLNHPHIIQVLDLGATYGKPFVVMQYLSGGDLSLKMERNHRLNHVEVLKWLIDIAEALDFIHGKNIIHRDIKPNNILFDEAENAFLADFGIAKMLQTKNILNNEYFPGTLDYVPPESASQQPAGPAYDQYALATVLYKAISGELPYGGETSLVRFRQKLTKPPRPLNSLIPDVPNKCTDAVMRALSTRPEERFKNCTEFVENFMQGVTEKTKSFQSSQPAPTSLKTKQPYTTTRIKKNIRQFNYLKYLYSVITFIVLLILIFSIWTGKRNIENNSIDQNSNFNKFLNYFIESNRTEAKNSTELIRAIQLGYQQTLDNLLQTGVSPNIRDEYGATALILATKLGNTKIVESLLTAGANPSVEDNEGWTALVHACWQDHTQVVALLLEAGVDPNDKNAIALITAIVKGNLEITKALVNAGADVNARDRDGIPALILVVASDGSHRISIAKTLLAAGANPRAYAMGKTPLLIAEEKHDRELFKLLKIRLENSNAWALEKSRILGHKTSGGKH